MPVTLAPPTATTSGDTQLGTKTYEAVKRALRMVGAYAADDEPSAQQLSDALHILNMILKTWQIEGFLWLKQFAYVLPNKGQQVYGLGTYGDHCVTSYNLTTVSLAANAGGASVTLTSASSITNGDFIGVEDTNGNVEWFYAKKVANVVSLYNDPALLVADALTASVAAGAIVYTHKVADIIERPTRVFIASRRQFNSVTTQGYDVPVNLISRMEYQGLPNKSTQGTVVQAYYDPQTTTGKFYVWPTANNSRDVLVLTVDRPLQIQSSDLNTYDFPEEWLELVCYALAERLWFEYPTSGADYTILFQRYAAMKDAVSSYDRENVSAYFQIARS